MNRRTYLGLLGGTTSLLAGCTSGDDSQSETPRRTPRTTTTAASTTTAETATTAPEPADFSVESFEFPDEVELNEEFTPKITVRNSGAQYGDLTAPLYQRKDGGEWEDIGDWRFQDVRPGSTVTAEAHEPWVCYYLGEYEYALGDFEPTTSFEAVSKRTSFGDTYVTPGDVRLSVTDADFKARYSREVGSSEDVVEAPDGKTFLFITVSARNLNDEAASLPHHSDWHVLAADREYEPDWDGYKDGRYEGGTVQPNVVRDGYVLFELPGDIDRSNYSIVWSERYSYGRASAFWSP